MTDWPVDQTAFIAFLLRAKRATYATQGGINTKVAPALAGSHQLEYREGDLLYRDIYFGSVFFVGEEVVYYDDAPLWVMNYGGGVTVEDVDPGAVGSFLQEAMRLVDWARPFRGPERHERAPYLYTDTSTGDIMRFHGIETILFADRPVYDLRYHGGALRG